MIKICPITGSDGCLETGCMFFKKEYTLESACSVDVAIIHLHEISENLKILVNQTGQGNNLVEEMAKTQLTGVVTDKLKQLAGVVPLKVVSNDGKG